MTRLSALESLLLDEANGQIAPTADNLEFLQIKGLLIFLSLKINCRCYLMFSEQQTKLQPLQKRKRFQTANIHLFET